MKTFQRFFSWVMLTFVVGVILMLLSIGMAKAATPTFANVAYGATNNRQVMDIYLPDDGRTDRAVVYLFHGGCFMGGDKSEMAPVIDKLLAAGIVAVNIEYTMAWTNRPASSYPASWMDAMTAVRAIRSNLATYGIQQNRQAVWGHSAGGTLAALLTVKPMFTPQWTQDSLSYAMNLGVIAHGREDFTHRDPALPADQMDCAEQWRGEWRTTESLPRFAAMSPFKMVNQWTPPMVIQGNSGDTTVLPLHPEAMMQAMITNKRPFVFIREGGGHYMSDNEQVESIAVLKRQFGLP